MNIGLLENAFDYILDAVQQLQGKRPSKRRIKYGIVVGRLQRDGHIQHKWHNDLTRKFLLKEIAFQKKEL